MDAVAEKSKADRSESRLSLGALSLLFFFLADVQTGVGPFLAAYLAASRWDERAVGFALTSGGLVTMALSPLAGAWVDASKRKRLLVGMGTAAIVAGALLITLSTKATVVFAAQVSIGAAGALLLPTVTAMTLGMVGREGFGRRFGINQSFNSAGNVFAALVLAGVSWWLGLRVIFIAAAAFAVPVWICLRLINPKTINNETARGADDGDESRKQSALDRFRHLCADRTLLLFFGCAFLFHLANAAMLPQLGEMLAKGNQRVAAPFMSACIIVTQLVIAGSAAWVGRFAGRVGRKPLLLAGFAVLPVRGVLYTLMHATTALIAIQVLDGVANAIFGVVAILVVADRMRGTGHFNFAQGALATCVGLGAALSTTLGGMLIHHSGYRASFLGLACVALAALLVLWIGVPETLPNDLKSEPGARC